MRVTFRTARSVINEIELEHIPVPGDIVDLDSGWFVVEGRAWHYFLGHRVTVYVSEYSSRNKSFTAKLRPFDPPHTPKV